MIEPAMGGRSSASCQQRCGEESELVYRNKDCSMYQYDAVEVGRIDATNDVLLVELVEMSVVEREGKCRRSLPL